MPHDLIPEMSADGQRDEIALEVDDMAHRIIDLLLEGQIDLDHVTHVEVTLEGPGGSVRQRRATSWHLASLKADA